MYTHIKNYQEESSLFPSMIPLLSEVGLCRSQAQPPIVRKSPGWIGGLLELNRIENNQSSV